jgi:hypothetical protein
MKLTKGSAEIVIGLIDGPVLTDHPDLVSEKIRTLPGKVESRCTRPDSAACVHGKAHVTWDLLATPAPLPCSR